MRDIKVGILTISDKASIGEREDKSGALLKDLVEFSGGEVAASKIVPDEVQQIGSTLIEWADKQKVQIIFTTGGTGLSERDVTPEATAKVIQREAPGFSEAIRQQSFEKTKKAILSRGISGIRGKTLIINLPGSPKAIDESFKILQPVLHHAVEILEGHTEHL
jgi:molybdenum cofactor synthesis domain-containing protein